jgi:hypothetical protein
MNTVTTNLPAPAFRRARHVGNEPMLLVHYERARTFRMLAMLVRRGLRAAIRRWYS